MTFQGTYQWQPTTIVPSGLHVRGQLRDTLVDDGHNVYLRTRVEGYAWSEIKGVQRKSVKIDKILADGAVLKTKEVRMQACLDRGALRPDSCSGQRFIVRP
ncbi:hypothetical protein ACFQ6B_27035 [Streptomyces wedmorensis]|uniref:Uncharacterized protein n=1 Tax=Streptomyces wedmorensis TaxID=43759 RepID=A0ABW6J9B3_STRWE